MELGQWLSVVNLAPGLVLLLALRKLIWCLRWLWCWRHGRPLPEDNGLLPHRSGEIFDGHVSEHEDKTGP